jgi:hypothetical protein
MSVRKANTTKVNKFLDSLSSEQTKIQYSYHIKRFKEHNHSKDLLLIKNPSDKIIEYLVGMKKERLSYPYRSLAYSSIKHFYKMNNVPLNWENIRMFLGEKTSGNKLRGYTHEEIQKLLSVADVTYTAIIFTYASTGMRRACLTDIKLTDLEPINIPPDSKIYKIKLYQNTEHEYTCFTTPEAASAIDLYIKTEKPETYLHRIKNKSISMQLRKLSLKVGIGSVGNNKKKLGVYRDVTPAVHALRKFAITQMKKSKVDVEVSKLLTDHSIGIRAKYVELTDEDLLKEYSLAFDNLTIDPAQRLQLKVKEQEQTITHKLQEKDSQMKQLQEKMDSLEGIMQEEDEYQQHLVREMKEMRKELDVSKDKKK